MADNQETFGAKFEIDVSNLKNGITQANRYVKQAQSEFKAAAAGMDDWRNSEEGLEAKLKSLNTISDMQEAKVNALQTAYNETAAEMGETSAAAMNLSIRLNNATADFNKTQKEIRDTDSALSDLKSGANEGGNATEQAGADAKDAAGNFDDFSGSITEAVTQLGAIAVAGMGISSLAEAVTGASNASAKLNAVLGVSGDEASKFDDALNNIYANNYGESFDDIAESATEVAKILGNDISSDALEEVTTQAIIMRDTFGSDVSESVKAADALMNNFGMTSEEAFDMLAAGAQSGLDKNGEMFDSFTEYAGYFADLGLSADDMFQGMQAGTDQFLMGADKSMDAWKEFGIRVIDGSASTAEGMTAIGLNADEMAAKFAAGGDTAKQATQETVEALMAMDDPVAQSQAGVALFGTQWEDMGESGMQAMFDLMGQAVDTKGTMEQINETRYDDIGSSLSAIGRAIQDSVLTPLVSELTPAISDFSQSVIPAVKDAGQWFIDNLPTIASLMVGLGAGFAVFKGAQLISAAVGALNAFKTAQEAATVAQALFNAVQAANPMMLIVTVVASVIAAIVTFIATNEDARNAIAGAWNAIVSTVSGAIDGIVGFFSNIGDSIGQFGEWFMQLPETIGTALGTALSLIGEWVSEVGAKALEAGSQFLTNIGEFFVQLPQNIFMFLMQVLVQIGTWKLQLLQYAIQAGQGFVDNIVNFIMSLPTRIQAFLSFAINYVVGFVSNMASKAQQAGSQFLNNIVNFMTQLPGRIASFLASVISNVVRFVSNFASNARNAGSQFLSNIGSMISQVPGKVMSFLNQIPGQISGFAGRMVSAGRNMINGLVNGISNGASAVVGKIQEICSGALDAVKNFFGIHSPSRVMQQMGHYIDEGLEIGIGDGLNDVSKMSEELAEAAKPKINSDDLKFDPNGGNGPSGDGSGTSTVANGGKIINVTQNNYSPKALTPREVYRQGLKLTQTLAEGV